MLNLKYIFSSILRRKSFYSKKSFFKWKLEIDADDWEKILSIVRKGKCTDNIITVLEQLKTTQFAENIIPTKLYPINEDVDKINNIEIINKVKLINKFWKDRFNKKVKIGVVGLNPHCESIDSFNEDQNIILPTIKKLKKLKYNIEGPLAADTIFLKNNRKKFNLIIGMYHDQVLTPIKTLFEYDAINITIGLPFIRVSPDHGPNESMLGKNKSNYLSLLNSIKFLDF